jgi:hypothetical protein
MSALEPVDGCPICITEMQIVIAEPHSVQPWPGGIRADYQCHACGHEWFTGWHRDALDLPEAGAA